MNDADKLIKYKEDLIENIKQALDIALQRTNDIELGYKELADLLEKAEEDIGFWYA